MRKILLFTDWYEPGFKAGGPIRSCVNFARHMRQAYEVYVFTSDRDLGASHGYEGIESDRWVSPGEGGQVYYASPKGQTLQNISRQIREVDPDFIYLNSMFSLRFTIFPLLISRFTRLRASVILSPRGMLRESALQFKPLKKKIFLHLLRRMGFMRSVSFHASDDTELKDVRRHFGPSARVMKIANFPAACSERPASVQKEVGGVSLLFIGRVHPIKNLDYLLEVLRQVKAVVRLTIVGGMEDKVFWEKCTSVIHGLPSNVTVEYAGEIPNQDLPAVINQHHLFVLPTKGENFGHAIFESLALGRPVLISDQTPWRNLSAERAGWDLPLDSPGLFRDAIETAAGFDQQQYDTWCQASLHFVKQYIEGMDLREDYKKLFS